MNAARLELVANNHATNAAHDALQSLHDNLDMRNAHGVKDSAEALLRALDDMGVEVQQP